MRWFSAALVALGLVGVMFWTFASALLAALDEGQSCADQAGGCDKTAEFIGLGRPVWIAFALTVAACILAYRRQPRPAWLLILSSFAPLVLIPLPDTSYTVNSYLLMVWFLVAVLAGTAAGLVLARRR